ncbi:MAG: hypothetical protein IPO88_06235 [Nannocystis sp.]|uniref:hypothetical protein n=1 Tax=Nannocystis sp. TaxID=1962667 RepID=UPI00242682F5|nr:hypothetical protein [Nannocystis sp.]MBK9753096.1 hypothetical protein [Nannocystis sp.]
MRTLRTLSCLAWLVLAVGTPACHLRSVEAPYAADAAPSAAQLLAAATPRISALQVSSAKVRVGRAPAGNLMFLAQKPGRFSGQVQIAGRELVSLAFHEQGYALRNVAADGLATGFYAGPPADCAIRQLIGVPFAASELIALVLGGAPLIAGPYEIVEQHWDRRAGHEVLRLRSTSAEQELRFAWVAGAWWVAGSTLWLRNGSAALTRVWTLRHEELRPVGTTVLPASTWVSRPNGRRDEKVSIRYRSQIPEPILDDASSPAESDDAGWEDEDTAASDEADTGAEPDPEASADGPTPEPTRPLAPAKIPPQFILDGAGLSPRGDLCRR